MEETAARLPDDVVREILVRVSTDVAALFRCAVTCKRWRALIADLSFLRRRWPENACHPSSLLGFFVQQRHNPNDGDDLFIGVDIDSPQPPVFVPPPPGSVLGSRRRFLTSFVPGTPAGLLDGAVPITARRGLLLVRLAPRTDSVINLAVCDPLAGTCDVLPPLMIKCIVYSISCAILTGADCCSSDGQQQLPPLPNYSTFFKVLIMVVVRSYLNDDQEWNLYAFSSAEPSWNAPRNCYEIAQRGFDILGPDNVAVCRGVAHWLIAYSSDHGNLNYYTLDVSAETGHVSLTELLIPASQLAARTYDGPRVSVAADGALSLFCLYRDGPRLEIWRRGDDGGWLRGRVVELKPPRQVWHPAGLRVWVGEKSDAVLAREWHGIVYRIDVETGAMEDVTEQFGGLGIMAVPVEIDWPALFVSLLRG